MFAVVKINTLNGAMEGHGPFGDKRNARKAQKFHDTFPWNAFVVPLTRPALPTDTTP